jgi:hypothetical protein
MAVTTEPSAAIRCTCCGDPAAADITPQGPLCEPCAEQRYDAYLDWYDIR